MPWKLGDGVRERRSMPKRRGDDGNEGSKSVRRVGVGVGGAIFGAKGCIDDCEDFSREPSLTPRLCTFTSWMIKNLKCSRYERLVVLTVRLFTAAKEARPCENQMARCEENSEIYLRVCI
jgi:hypothetical protein